MTHSNTSSICAASIENSMREWKKINKHNDKPHRLRRRKKKNQSLLTFKHGIHNDVHTGEIKQLTLFIYK